MYEKLYTTYGLHLLLMNLPRIGDKPHRRFSVRSHHLDNFGIDGFLIPITFGSVVFGGVIGIGGSRLTRFIPLLRHLNLVF